MRRSISVILGMLAATACSAQTASEKPNETQELRGDSRSGGAEWNEFYHSPVGVLQAKQAYRVSFDYEIVAQEANAQFYALFRREGGSGSAGWRDWQGKPGATGRVEMALATRRVENYTLVFGVRNRGAVIISHLKITLDPANVPPDSALPNPVYNWKSPGHRAYYADSQNGNDANDGRSPKTAWKTLTKINSGQFAAGDKILLRAGSHWAGFIAPGGRGNSKSPITLSRYGEGPKPRINAESQFLAALYLHNVEHWTVSGLDIANTGNWGLPNLAGALVSIQDFGTAHQIALKNLDIHDVGGSLIKSEGGGNGVSVTASGEKVKSRYDGLLIENCRLTHTDRNGITMSGYWSRADWFPSLRVVIRGNSLSDIGGDGIVPIACDGALVERNIITGCRLRCDDSAAGIWAWSCDNTTVQYNEVSGMKGTRDGQGFDSDWNCRNTLFQYNYSHDNEGGFMLICNDGSVNAPWSLGNVGTVIRYNVSKNDGARTFEITGPCRDTLIYNNTLLIGKTGNVLAVKAGNWGGDWTENTRFINNIFYAEGAAKFDFGGMRKTRFERNIFYGTLGNRPEDSAALFENPRFADAGKNGADGLRPGPDSPCRRAGKIVTGNGGHDFRRCPVPATEPPPIGAFQ